MVATFRLTVTENRIGQLATELRAKAADVVKKTALDIEADAKTRVPVDTGFLRNSITADLSGDLSATVSVGADYGVYVEFGTYKSRAQPFLTPAAEAARGPFAAAMAKLLE